MDAQKHQKDRMLMDWGKYQLKEAKKMSEMSFRADRLNELMKERKLNAGKLAYLTGISRTMIFYLQKGERTSTSGEYLAKLADALSTSTQYLIEETDDPSPIQKRMSALVADIAGVAEELSPAKQRQLRALGKALLEIEKSADVDTIYSELMDHITRLAELDGGKSALSDLISHLESMAPRPSSPPVQRRSHRQNADSDGESVEQPSEGNE